MQHLLQGNLRRSRRANRLGLFLLAAFLTVLVGSMLVGLAPLVGFQLN